MTTVSFVAGGLVFLLGDGDAGDHVAELQLTGLLGDDRHVVRIPGDDLLALLDLATVLDGR
jgi:hypothetical protein